jgi:cell wall-associated NlpC family hydrolase
MAKHEFIIEYEDTSLSKGTKMPNTSVGTYSIAGSDKTTAPSKLPPIAGLEMPQAPSGSVGSIDEMFNKAREWTGHPYLSPSLVNTFGENKAIQLVAAKTLSNKRAIDCSGFAQEVLNYAGIDPPGDQTAEGLHNYFQSAGTKLQTPQKGALIFFEPTEKSAPDSGKWDAGRKITHVAFSLGGNKILDSSSGRGVSEHTLQPEGKYKYHYIMPNYKFEKKGS